MNKLMLITLVFVLLSNNVFNLSFKRQYEKPTIEKIIINVDTIKISHKNQNYLTTKRFLQYSESKMNKFNSILSKTIKYEGSFQQDCRDSGNWVCGKLIGTKYGISAKALKHYIGKCPTVSDMQNLSKEIAIKIYKFLFWDAIRGDNIKNKSVAELIFATYIGNPSKSRQLVHETLLEFGISANTSTPFSDRTVDAINNVNQKAFHKLLWIKKRSYLLKLSNHYPQWIKGWLNRHNNHIFIPEKITVNIK